MPEILFSASFDNERKDVVISQPHSGGQCWEIKIGGVGQGKIYERQGGYYYEGTELSFDDVQAITDRIIDYKGESWQQANIHIPLSHKEYWAQFPPIIK